MCKMCLTLDFFTHFISSLVNKIEFGICDIVFTLKTKASFFFFFFLFFKFSKAEMCFVKLLAVLNHTSRHSPANQSFFCVVFICVSFFPFFPLFSLSNLQLCFLINPHFTYASHMSFSSPFSNLIAWQHSPLLPSKPLAPVKPH